MLDPAESLVKKVERATHHLIQLSGPGGWSQWEWGRCERSTAFIHTTSPILQLCLTFPPTGWHRLYHLHCYFVWHMAQIWSHFKGRSFICWFIYQSFIMSEILEISNIKWHLCFWCWVNIIFLGYHNSKIYITIYITQSFPIFRCARIWYCFRLPQKFQQTVQTTSTLLSTMSTLLSTMSTLLSTM